VNLNYTSTDVNLIGNPGNFNDNQSRVSILLIKQSPRSGRVVPESHSETDPRSVSLIRTQVRSGIWKISSFFFALPICLHDQVGNTISHSEFESERDKKDAAIIRLYMSLFSVSKLIQLFYPVSKATFDSLIRPSEPLFMRRVVDRMKELFPSLIARYLPWVTSIPLELGLEWTPRWTSQLTMVRSANGKGRPQVSVPIRASS